jgi:adenine-specific DNA-methyltransferase
MEKITKDHPLSKSEDILQSNIDTLKALFPTIVKEGKIDLKELEALLSDEIETSDEYYRFNWAGKSDARREANKPSTATLRPVKEESKNWDTTENIFIEGDNLEVLKLLQKSYPNQIKMIYVDPPYNTGNDFVYKDNYTDNLSNYLSITGQINSEGNKLNTNSESGGRFHSNWLNMIYPRLKLARNLLKENGVIFISIGQDELKNLIAVCDEIFGEENRISIIGRISKSGGNKGKFFSPNLEYILCYAKNIYCTDEFRDNMSEDLIKKVYTQIETEGERKGEKYRSMGLYQSSLDARANQRYFIEAPDGSLVIPSGQTFPIIKKEGEQVTPESDNDGVWRWTYSTYINEKAKGNIEFKETKNNILVDENGVFSKWNLNTKIWLKDRQEEGQLPTDLISKFESRHSSKEVEALNIPFDFPKPIGLIKHLATICRTKGSDIILDFFAGSGTTAHSILELNLEDLGNRKFICVQLPEAIEEKSDAFKAGFKTIAEITKERIRRAGDKIELDLKNKIESEKNKKSSELQLEVESQVSTESILNNLDTGFKVFKLDTSNINSWDGSVENFESNLSKTESNIKIERTEEDVLFEILIKYGLNLTVPISEKTINNCNVYNVGYGALFVCLSIDITTSVAEEIGKWKEELNPTSCRVIFRDNGFANDVAKTNSIQILKRFGINEINSI